MDAPTPEEVRDRSELLELRYPELPANDEKLSEWIEEVAPVLSDLTGRSLGAGIPGEGVPDYLVPVAHKAFALKLEGVPVGGEGREEEMDNLRLRSFSAGPYSESYFGPGEAAEYKMLDPDRRLHEILWALATEDKKAYWLARWNDRVEPAAGVQTFNFRGRRRRRWA